MKKDDLLIDLLVSIGANMYLDIGRYPYTLSPALLRSDRDADTIMDSVYLTAEWPEEMMVPNPHTGMIPCVFSEVSEVSGAGWNSKYLCRK